MKIPEPSSSHWFIPPPVVGSLWIFGFGLIDWLTGPELGLSAFYVPGIALTAWFSGRKAALWISLLAALVWLAAEIGSEKVFSQPFIPYWNAVIRFSIFSTIALLASEVRIRQKTEVALRDQQEILASVLDSMRDGVLVANRDGQMIICNPAAHRIFGRIELGGKIDDWVSRVQSELLDHAPTSLENEQPLRIASAGKISGYWELALRSNGSGGRIQLGVTALPLLRQNSDQAGVVLVFNDLTARRNLENQVSQASEREQRRIGQDLHDGICQHLAGVAFSTEILQGNLERHSMPDQAEEAAEIAVMIREGIKQTRDIARGLYPDGIEEGLATALESLASTTSKRSGIVCHFQHDGGNFQLSSVAAGHVYRIAQESVTNAVRHAKPKEIRIHLEAGTSSLTMDVSDNGPGLGSSSRAERGIGQQIMRYRANLIGAKLDISSRDGEGTRISLKVPLQSGNPV